MYLTLIRFFISFFDFFKKKKILNFFKKKVKNDISLFIDVGAHYGETIKLFCTKSFRTFVVKFRNEEYELWT